MQNETDVVANPAANPPATTQVLTVEPIENRRPSWFRDILETVILVVVVVTVSQTVLANYVIQQDSAVPNFYPNQRVFVDKVIYRLGGLHRGDIVVTHAIDGGTDDLFKRVVGLPGETIDIRSNQVFINNAPINEPYLAADADSGRGVRSGVLPRTLSADEYFLMGDNRSYSQDSRAFGPFPKSNLVGRVWLRYWPLETFKLVQGAEYK